MASFQIADPDSSPLVVVLEGRFDVAGVHAVELDLSRQVSTRRRPTIVDLSAVTFVGSMGIGMVVAMARALALHGTRLAIAAPQPLVETALRNSGIDQGMPIAADVARAAQILDGT